MRWIVALSLGCTAGMLALECGGTAFTIDVGPADATSEGCSDDVSSDVSAVGDSAASDVSVADDGDSSDVSPADASVFSDVHTPLDAAFGDVSEAAQSDATDAGAIDAADASGARDAMGADARPLSDASDADAEEASTPHCGGQFACAPVVPVGWTGPFELSAGATPSPMCGPNFSGPMLNGNSGLSAQPASCGCTCNPTQAPCPATVVEFYASSSICGTVGAAPCASVTLTPGVCTTVDALQTCLAGVAGVVMTIPASSPSQGSCTPIPNMLVPSYAWATGMRACSPSVVAQPADCPTGNLCLPAPAAPFTASLCVEQAGDTACPSADPSTGYSVKHLYYGGVDDQRGCSACSCPAASGPSCAVTLNQYGSTDGGCSGMPVSYGAGRCLPVQQPADLQVAPTASIASCAASMTTPTGSATPTKPTTFCCTP
jgi:hypothetical protein